MSIHKFKNYISRLRHGTSKVIQLMQIHKRWFNEIKVFFSLLVYYA